MGHSSFGEDGFCFVGISLVLEVYLRYIQLIVSGAVAHLARAIEWHSIGGRFDPDQLQIDKSDKKNIWNQKGHRPYDSDYSWFTKQLIKKPATSVTGRILYFVKSKTECESNIRHHFIA